MIPSRYVDVVFEKVAGEVEPHPATMYVFYNGEWKNFESIDPNHTRRGWVLSKTPIMETPAWAPMHFEVTDSDDMFDGVWWLNPTTQHGPYNWEYWIKRRFNYVTYDCLNVHVLDVEAAGSFGDTSAIGNLIFPIAYTQNTNSGDGTWDNDWPPRGLDSENPYYNILYQASSPNRFWETDFTKTRTDRYFSRIFFVQRDDYFTNSDFEDFVPSTMSSSRVTWILSPGAFSPWTMKESMRRTLNGSGHVPRPMGNFSSGGVTPGYNELAGYCLMTPAEDNTVFDGNLSTKWSSQYQVLCYIHMDKGFYDTVLNDENYRSSVRIRPVGGYPLDFYGPYGTSNRWDLTTNLPTSWVSGMEVISCPEDGYDIVVTVVNTTSKEVDIDTGENRTISTAKISAVWIRHRNLVSSQSSSERIFVSARWEKKFSYSVSSDLIGHNSVILNAATLYPRPNADSGSSHGVFIGFTHVGTSWEEVRLDRLFSKTEWVCIDNPPVGSDIGTVWESAPQSNRFYDTPPTEMPDTLDLQFNRILSKTIVKQTDVPGRSAALTRADNDGEWENHPWLRPFPSRNGSQYAPGEARFRWMDIPAGEEPTNVVKLRPESTGSNRWLVADFRFCFDSDIHPEYSRNWTSPVPQAGFNQVLLPKRVALPWERTGPGAEPQADPLFSYKQTLLPGEFNNLTVYKDNRSNTPGREGWVFACVGLRRINDTQPDMGFDEAVSEPDTRDSLTLLHLEVPPLGVDGIDYNVDSYYN